MPANAAEGAALLVPGTIDRLGGRDVHWVHQPGLGPAVVLLGGCGVPYYVWDDVVGGLVDLQVERMDRPGLVGTPWPGILPTLAAEVETLAELVARAGAPALVVAHSMAGLHAEALARLHPHLVAGLVLVDSSVDWDPIHPGPGQTWLRVARATHLVMGVGPLRRLGSLADRVLVAKQSGRRRLLNRTSEVAKAVYRSRDTMAQVIAEQAAYAAQIYDLAQVRKSTTMPDVPVVVVTASGDGGAQWVEDQARLARLLRGQHVVVEDSLHLIMIDRPDRVVDAVRSVRGQHDQAQPERTW